MNKIKQSFHFKSWITILIISFHFSCSENPFSKSIKEGVIIYNITYPSIPEDNVMLDLMPKKMEMSFCNNSYRTDIIAGMGLFKTSIISEAKKNQLTHSVKMLNKKHASVLSSSDIENMNPELKGIEIKITGEVKEVAGFKCQEAIIFKKGVESFKVYFTDDIKIKDPNKATPFKDIPGVLMEYEMVNYDTHMHFIVDEVIEKEVHKDDLLLEEGYEMVNAERLSKEIQSIFNKVK
jgi:GLPGLI family protein